MDRDDRYLATFTAAILALALALSWACQPTPEPELAWVPCAEDGDGENACVYGSDD